VGSFIMTRKHQWVNCQEDKPPDLRGFVGGPPMASPHLPQRIVETTGDFDLQNS
jgi:hypothetical protein